MLNILFENEFNLIQTVIVGCGNAGHDFLSYTQKKNIAIQRAFDSDQDKTGKKIHNLKVEKLSDIKKHISKIKCIIITSVFESEIRAEIADYLTSLDVFIISQSAFIFQFEAFERKKQYGFVGLHIGCGGNYYKEYLNCDIKNADFLVDVRNSIDLPDQIVNFIYSEHFIEHILFDEALFFMRESYRLLKKGGIFRCLMPDFSMLLEIIDNRPDLIKRIKQKFTEGVYNDEGQCIMKPVLSKDATELWDARDDICNSFMRRYGHKYLWSANHLKKALKKIGFNKVFIMNYGQSSDKRICLESPNRWGKEWTSVIEGIK